MFLTFWSAYTYVIYGRDNARPININLSISIYRRRIYKKTYRIH